MFIPNTFGQMLKRLRADCGLSLRKLAERTGIDFRRISDLELERRPATRREVYLLGVALGDGAFDQLRRSIGPPRGPDPWMASRRDIARRFEVRSPRPQLARPHSGRLYRAAHRLAPEVDAEIAALIRGRADRRDLLRFLARLPVESTLEALFVGHLAAGESVPVLLPVQNLGFRTHPVVDRKTGMHVGDVPVPALWVRFANLEAIFFCQVTVRPVDTDYRPDFLCAIRINRRTSWVIIEIDGWPKARDDYQKRREVELSLPMIRISPEDLRARAFLQTLEGRILRALPDQARSRSSLGSRPGAPTSAEGPDRTRAG